MSARLPPLSSLPVFEAAARLENFSRAADEIHVTHGAVSHQVRALEDFLGVSLFARQGRGVVLTVDGRVFANAVRAALEEIGGAAQALRRRAASNRLSISVMPSFGSRWLMPRIVGFMAAHPAWAVNIDSSPGFIDFAREDIDVAVRFGRGGWRGLHCEWLMDDEHIMVARPDLHRGLPNKPTRLADYPLLRSDPEPWAAWCLAAGIDLKLPTEGIDYQDSGVMLQAAIDGQGIMLTRRSLAAGEIARGTLVQLFDIAAPSRESYWIVWPEDREPSDRVVAFRDWIVRETSTRTAPPPSPKRRGSRGKPR